MKFIIEKWMIIIHVNFICAALIFNIVQKTLKMKLELMQYLGSFVQIVFIINLKLKINK
ncbi:hypothetical protein EZS27_041376 [termite gut metagenome]|uniref:Uncharacterized protein n=1 Tax=termite gut metagenome TaxID=433724 RepID=A0A5J4PES8_9ZZZZ